MNAEELREIANTINNKVNENRVKSIIEMIETKIKQEAMNGRYSYHFSYSDFGSLTPAERDLIEDHFKKLNFRIDPQAISWSGR